MGERDSNFNIFKMLEGGNREVAVCHFLGDLFNPKGSHDEGTRFLERFLTVVLKIDPLFVLPGPPDAGATVKLDEPIGKNQFVDIVIRGGDYFTSRDTVLPFEVRLYSDDQPGQLYDCYHYYFGDNSTKKIYYLTADGRAPSEESVTGSDGSKLLPENVKTLSFKEDIKEWLQGLYESNEWLRDMNPFLTEVVDQFIEACDEIV